MIVYWESLQTLSRELNESKRKKDIVRGQGEQLLAVISTSTYTSRTIMPLSVS